MEVKDLKERGWKGKERRGCFKRFHISPSIGATSSPAEMNLNQLRRGETEAAFDEVL